MGNAQQHKQAAFLVLHDGLNQPVHPLLGYLSHGPVTDSLKTQLSRDNPSGWQHLLHPEAVDQPELKLSEPRFFPLTKLKLPGFGMGVAHRSDSNCSFHNSFELLMKLRLHLFTHLMQETAL